MVVNDKKYIISTQNLEGHELDNLMNVFPFQLLELDPGLKYLGIHSKPNCYKKEHWS